MSCLKNIASTCTWEQYNILISIMSCEGFTEQQEIVYILTATNYLYKSFVTLQEIGV